MTELVKNLSVMCAKEIIKRRCTAQDLAEELGVTDRTIYRYLKDKLPLIDKKLHKEVLTAMAEIRSENMTAKYPLRYSKNSN